MKLADSRQGYGWISIVFHWLVVIATFYLLYNGMNLEDGDGGERFARGAGDAGQRLVEGARQFGQGVANAGRQVGGGFADAGRQFAENVFAPRSLHISIGTIVVIIIIARIAWRLIEGAQPKSNNSRALNLIATVVQWGLLAALLVLAATRPLLVWGMGQPIPVFNWFAIPSPLPDMRGWRETIQHVHSLAAYAIFPLVGLHILGALKHALIDRDGVLRRMLVPRRA